MSGIRDLIVVSASVLAFSVIADADELRPARAQGIDLAGAAAPAVEVDHDPRVHIPSLGGKTIADVPIWRTVTLGTYKTIDALRHALHAERIHVEDTADELLSRPTFNLSKTKRDARLVVLAVSELGFEDEGVSLADISARARQLGFALCPAEVGPQLRLQYLNQPLGQFLHIAMAPIARYGGEPTDFTVANGGGGLILIAGDAHPKFIMPSTTRFVFIGPEAPQRPETNRPGLVSAASVTGPAKVENQIDRGKPTSLIPFGRHHLNRSMYRKGRNPCSTVSRKRSIRLWRTIRRAAFTASVTTSLPIRKSSNSR